jgi:hypothetical protein
MKAALLWIALVGAASPAFPEDIDSKTDHAGFVFGSARDDLEKAGKITFAPAAVRGDHVPMYDAKIADGATFATLPLWRVRLAFAEEKLAVIMLYVEGTDKVEGVVEPALIAKYGNPTGIERNGFRKTWAGKNISMDLFKEVPFTDNNISMEQNMHEGRSFLVTFSSADVYRQAKAADEAKEAEKKKQQQLQAEKAKDDL